MTVLSTSPFRRQVSPGTVRDPRVCGCVITSLLTLLSVLPALASENAPHRPFAEWADVPNPGQFIVGMVYEESEAYHMWAGGKYRNITVHSGGEDYGIDNHQGYISLQYGINERWAADLNFGYATAGNRSFFNGEIQSTSGLMDTSFGVRYQLWNEATAGSPWIPTLTFRAGAVLPGTYSESFPFAPGTRSAAIEPELLLRKHFGWPGLGVFADGLFRWNRTTHNDQYITAIGLFQQIKSWELDVGYRHLGTITGTDISFTDPADSSTIVYPKDVREINDAIDAGFSYTTSKHHLRYGFHSRVVVDGNNSDAKFWVGGSLDIPIGGRK